ncbi:hypothetical protein E2C01_043782 [Portunus trituberculatus]|uniref:Uncharacterized protein n=1 Tax=Portunus trituberculatus TaxID=210409 RepID=A0A5B7FWL4_PORTR|nr:hypothetical protein [Portunus trituberculatus]
MLKKSETYGEQTIRPSVREANAFALDTGLEIVPLVWCVEFVTAPQHIHTSFTYRDLREGVRKIAKEAALYI